MHLEPRPRALAVGQAIMQHPGFSQQRSMLENLLQFDALLDQYELASGHSMPDDLVVSTVMRCLDGGTRRHLEMVMDENMNYAALKDKLILLDKNTKAWSGDSFLKHLQIMNQPSSSKLFWLPRTCPNGSGSSPAWTERKVQGQERFQRQERQLVRFSFWRTWHGRIERWSKAQVQRQEQEREQRKAQRQAARRKRVWWWKQ